MTIQHRREFDLIITVASFKGGQAKTTTAIHLTALLHQHSPALLVDGDPNRSATSWNRRKGFPFKVVDEKQAVRFAKDVEHVIIDTQARPTEEDLKALADGCDLLIVPLTPDALSLDTLFLFTDTLTKLGANRFKILLTIVPPKPSRDGEEVLNTLREAGLPFFQTVIRRYKVFQKAALDGVLVKDVADLHAADAWADYKAIAGEVLR
jgi:chromosome partitioning protein